MKNDTLAFKDDVKTYVNDGEHRDKELPQRVLPDIDLYLTYT